MTGFNRNRWGRLLVIGLMTAAGSAGADDLLDDIQIRTEQGVTEYELDFTIPITYVRHFPPEQSQLLKLYLWGAGMEDSEPVDLAEYKPRHVGPSLPFTVRYTTVRQCFGARDEAPGRQPICLDIQFSQTVHYRIRPGTDGRSILLTVIPATGTVSPGSKK